MSRSRKFVLARQLFLGIVGLLSLFTLLILLNSPKDSAVESTGSLIAFQATFLDSEDGYSDIFSIRSDGSELINLTKGQKYEANPDWSPDGSRLAFNFVYAEGNQAFSDIYIMQADGKDRIKLTRDGKSAEPTWSPDGTRIAFISYKNGSPEIYVMNADGSEQRRLTSDQQVNSEPDWSPDGKHIVFRCRFAICVINPDGSNRINLSKSRDGFYPSWSPDSESIVFASVKNEHADIFVMKADGTKSVNLTKGNGYSEYPAWSSDGRKIIFSHSKRGRAKNYGIYIMNSDGSGKTLLVHNQQNPRINFISPTWQPSRTDKISISRSSKGGLK